MTRWRSEVQVLYGAPHLNPITTLETETPSPRSLPFSRSLQCLCHSRWPRCGRYRFWIRAMEKISSSTRHQEPPTRLFDPPPRRSIDRPVRPSLAFRYPCLRWRKDISRPCHSPHNPVETIRSGLPDGMTIDEAGNLWVAHWGGGAVRCWCPKTGRCLAQIPLPCTQVTSCAFGGKDLDELLITTAQSGLSEVALAQEPMAGSLFVSRPGVRGLPTKTFAAEKN